MKSIYKIAPSIKKIAFKLRGKIEILLEDGREIIMPLKYFPSIQKLNKKERSYYTIMDGEMIMFKNSDFIYHIQDFLREEQDYMYKG